MIHPDPEMRRDILCIGGTSQWPCTVFRGIDQWGERYGYILVDPIGGAIGAFAHADGINTGGQVRTPICQLPNVEHTEQSFPVLFLYRKELPDSGGAGRFRGGMSAESCFIPHNTEEIVQDTLSSGNAAPTSPGLMGGYPSTTNRYAYVTASDIRERFERAEMPEDIDEVDGTPVHLELRQQNLVQRASDVYAVRWCGGGGFGDPAERAPAAVQADLDNFAISQGAARAIYSAVVDESGRVDEVATARHRERLRAERVKRFARPSTTRAGDLLHEVTPYLHAKRDNRGAFWACAQCGTELGGVEENYKLGCNREDRHISDSNPLIGEPRDFVNDEVEFRQFSCPGCGTLIENEVAVASDPVLRDIELHLSDPGPSSDEEDETSYLLRSSRNAERLRASIAEVESGDTVAATIENGTITAKSREGT